MDVLIIPPYTNFIARNEKGDLRAFKHEPVKDNKRNYWFFEDGALTEFGVKVNETDDSYAHVQWENEYPKPNVKKIKKTGFNLILKYYDETLWKTDITLEQLKKWIGVNK